jgi:hypothetical protein
MDFLREAPEDYLKDVLLKKMSVESRTSDPV